MIIHTQEQFYKYVHQLQEKKIFIWGASVFGEILGKVFDRRDIEWCGYYDNFSMDVGKKFNNKEIYSLKTRMIEKMDVFVLTMRSYMGVCQQLKDIGVDEENIICFGDYQVLESFQKELMQVENYSQKISVFKNIHGGKRCFIIGNGPSLSISDLELLKNEYTFGCNLIFQCFDKTDWRPTYYSFIDVNGIRTTFDTKEKLLNVLAECGSAFVRGTSSLYQYRDDEDIKNLYYMNMVYSPSEEQFDFSDDCAKQVYMGYTVTYTMIQLAVYMGFKEIYLIGIDHNFSKIINSDGTVHDGTINKANEHSNILGNYNLPNGTEVYKLENSYLSAKKYAEGLGVKIYNSTRGGKLEIFERKDFDEVIKNNEL